MERIDRAIVERIEQDVRGRFPGGTIRQVTVVQYGDDPAIEPGQAGIEVTFDPARLPEGYQESLDAFHLTHKDVIRQLRRDLPHQLPEVRRVEFVDGDDPRNRMTMRFDPSEAAPGDLTAVTARLAPEDLETLDTLVAAGITPTRAQAVRWAVARIRERPAYARLRSHAQQIEELKAQF